MIAALTAPMNDAVAEDDSSILAVVFLRGSRTYTWVSPAASANPRVLAWCRHALDGGLQYADLTMLDLMALPAVA